MHPLFSALIWAESRTARDRSSRPSSSSRCRIASSSRPHTPAALRPHSGWRDQRLRDPLQPVRLERRRYRCVAGWMACGATRTSPVARCGRGVAGRGVLVVDHAAAPGNSKIPDRVKLSDVSHPQERTVAFIFFTNAALSAASPGGRCVLLFALRIAGRRAGGAEPRPDSRRPGQRHQWTRRSGYLRGSRRRDLGRLSCSYTTPSPATPV